MILVLVFGGALLVCLNAAADRAALVSLTSSNSGAPSCPKSKLGTIDFESTFQDQCNPCCHLQACKARGDSIRVDRCKLKNYKSFPWAAWASSA
jgi:hypothetical protein